MKKRRPNRFVKRLAFVCVLGSTIAAEAHPHIFVDTRAEVIFNAAGQVTSVKNIWRFDDAFSAYAKQGLEHQRNGKLTDKSLEALARVNIHSLATYHYFTFVHVDGKRVPLGEGSDQKLEDDGQKLTLTFVVTPPAPLDPKLGPITFDIYDPEYFAAVGFVKDKPVKLINGPKGCHAQIFTPSGLTPAAAAAIASVPASQRTLPPELQTLTGGIQNGLVIDCSLE